MKSSIIDPIRDIMDSLLDIRLLASPNRGSWEGVGGGYLCNEWFPVFWFTCINIHYLGNSCHNQALSLVIFFICAIIFYHKW